MSKIKEGDKVILVEVPEMLRYPEIKKSYEDLLGTVMEVKNLSENNDFLYEPAGILISIHWCEKVEGNKPDEKVVNHPNHYTWIKDIECTEVVSHFDFNSGAAIKYIWRHGKKDDAIQDLKKAIKHINFRIKYLEENK